MGTLVFAVVGTVISMVSAAGVGVFTGSAGLCALTTTVLITATCVVGTRYV